MHLIRARAERGVEEMLTIYAAPAGNVAGSSPAIPTNSGVSM